jgi:hypothetical protein
MGIQWDFVCIDGGKHEMRTLRRRLRTEQTLATVLLNEVQQRLELSTTETPASRESREAHGVAEYGDGAEDCYKFGTDPTTDMREANDGCGGNGFAAGSVNRHGIGINV